MKSLSRDEMKSLKGGEDTLDNGGDAWYKCCWTNEPTNCSVCARDGASCVSGATLTAC